MSHPGLKKMFFVYAQVCYQYNSAHILLPFPSKNYLKYTCTTKVKCPQHNVSKMGLSTTTVTYHQMKRQNDHVGWTAKDDKGH